MALKVAILGFELEGQSSLAYWQTKGAEITVCDQDTTKVVPQGVATQLGPNYLQNLDRFDVIMRTPGLKPRDILAANPDVADKITTNADEFLRVCPTVNTIGVTGTKGKGTTSTLIARILEAAGKRVHLGGNIGLPPLELLQKDIQPDDWVVLELSSFQLIDIRQSTQIAVCVMVVPEHLNWHADLNEYLHAKQQLFGRQKPDDIAIFFNGSEYSQQIASASPGQHIPYFSPPGAYIADDNVTIDGQSISKVSEVKLLGEHNLQNICAAVTAVWQVSKDVEAIRSVITSFSGLEHRLELVRDFQGVKYYDDSFGTTPETAIVAIKAFDQPKVVILGGSDKGASYDDLAKTVAESNVRKVVLIGVTAPAIQTALQAIGYLDVIQGGDTMSDIVAAAHAAAQPGDVVLLSTGCASFDMFHDYKDRGAKFTAAVQALA